MSYHHREPHTTTTKTFASTSRHHVARLTKRLPKPLGASAHTDHPHTEKHCSERPHAATSPASWRRLISSAEMGHVPLAVAPRPGVNIRRHVRHVEVWVFTHVRRVPPRLLDLGHRGGGGRTAVKGGALRGALLGLPLERGVLGAEPTADEPRPRLDRRRRVPPVRAGRLPKRARDGDERRNLMPLRKLFRPPAYPPLLLKSHSVSRHTHNDSPYLSPRAHTRGLDGHRPYSTVYGHES